MHGYKFMHLKCIQSGLVVKQETIRVLLQIIDADGVNERRRGRLRRRIYSNPGPDFMWHIDSYDKLKPFGICINGCIDGYSRCVLWLEAYKTNSDPAVIASYFMTAVRERMGCPKRIRADRGTENGHIEQMQRFLRFNHLDEFSYKSFLYGSSNHNQRIEAWWSHLRSHNVQFWINLFQTLKNDDQFDGNILDKNLIRFCFMRTIQDELNGVKNLWNTHRIRRNRYQGVPNGRPLTMYLLPHLYGTHTHICPVSPESTRVCEEECTYKEPYPCDKDVFDLCCILMHENDLEPPTDSASAVELYKLLRLIINQNL